MIKWLPKKYIDFQRLQQLLLESNKTGMYTNYGPCVRTLENMMHSFLELDNNKSVIATSSGTSAFDSIIASISTLHNIDHVRVRTQSFTFPTSAQTKYPNTTTICDVSKDGSIDPVFGEEDIAVATTIFGSVPDLPLRISECEKAGTILVLDNAASPLSYQRGTNISNMGTASIISLHHTKPIGFGEGGLVVIDKEYEETVRSFINFGLANIEGTNIRKWERHASNWRMSDISAACIIQHIERFQKKMQSIKSSQDFFIASIPEQIEMFPSMHSSETVLSCLPVLFNRPVETKYFEDRGIEAKKYYSPLSTEECGNSLDFFERIICFPSHEDMGRNDYKYMLETIKQFLGIQNHD